MREKGTEIGSRIFFNTPTQNAKRMLYYPIVAGEYFCNRDYCVEREQYDSFLILFVAEGKLTLHQNGEEYTAQKNELLLVDCYKPHKYFAGENAHTIWLHFDGADSKIWYQELVRQKGIRIKGNQSIGENIRAIMTAIEKGDDIVNIGLHFFLKNVRPYAASCNEA